MARLQRVLALSVLGLFLHTADVRGQVDAAPVAPQTDEPPVPPANQPDSTPAPDVTPAPEVTPDAAADPDSPPPPAEEPQPSNPFAAPETDPIPYSAQPGTLPPVQTIHPPEDPFLPPAGMVTPPACLIDLLGFYGHHPFVYSDSNCFDLASAAYRCGYYEDAIALLSHAIEQNPQAHYYYLRGMSQMKAGLAHDAIASADGVLDAVAAGFYGGLDRVSERFNGPLGVQFRQLLELREAS